MGEFSCWGDECWGEGSTATGPTPMNCSTYSGFWSVSKGISYLTSCFSGNFGVLSSNSLDLLVLTASIGI